MAELPVIQADSSLSLCHNAFDAFDGIYVVSQVRLAVASSTAVRIQFPSTNAPGKPFCKLRNQLEAKGREDTTGRDRRR